MSELVGAYIEIIDICNAACPYCYNEDIVNNGDMISYDVLTKILRDIANHKITHVAFSGGEPFLYEELQNILKFSYSIGMSVAIVSNGTCFEDDNIPILLKYNPNLQLTFDGHNDIVHDHTRGDGNFRRLISGISKVKRLGYTGKITVRHNLSVENIVYFPEFLSMISSNFEIDCLTNRDIENISLAPIRKTKNNTYNLCLDLNDFSKYTEFFKQIDFWNDHHTVKLEHDFKTVDTGCPYNTSPDDVKCGIRIAPDGNVYPCQLFVDEEFRLGNINTQSLDEILNGDVMVGFINKIRARKNTIENCRCCVFGPMCGCGCPAYAFIENNTINSITPRCDIRKSTFRDSIKNVLRGN